MALSSETQTRWVVQDIDREAVTIAKEMAARHRVTIHEVLEQAIMHYDDDLGRVIELPAGWRKPRDW